MKATGSPQTEKAMTNGGTVMCWKYRTSVAIKASAETTAIMIANRERIVMVFDVVLTTSSLASTKHTQGLLPTLGAQR